VTFGSLPSGRTLPPAPAQALPVCRPRSRMRYLPSPAIADIIPPAGSFYREIRYFPFRWKEKEVRNSPRTFVDAKWDSCEKSCRCSAVREVDIPSKPGGQSLMGHCSPHARIFDAYLARC
jgi:hypothetical protein